MNGKCLEELFTAHFRGERAIAAARRFISRNSNVSLAGATSSSFFAIVATGSLRPRSNIARPRR